MPCIFRKMPYVFLSINKQNFSYAIKNFLRKVFGYIFGKY